MLKVRPTLSRGNSIHLHQTPRLLLLAVLLYLDEEEKCRAKPPTH